MNDLLNLHPEKNSIIDTIQAAMEILPQVEVKPSHVFLPGMYIREVIVPEGIQFVTKVHNSAHPCFVCGICDVYDSLTDTIERIYGFWKGITQPGTRRVFEVISETNIITTHAVPFITGAENALSDIEKEALALEIEKFIIEPHEIILNLEDSK